MQSYTTNLRKFPTIAPIPRCLKPLKIPGCAVQITTQSSRLLLVRTPPLNIHRNSSTTRQTKNAYPPCLFQVPPGLDDKEVRVAVAYVWVLISCAPHTCHYGTSADASGLHAFAGTFTGHHA